MTYKCKHCGLPVIMSHRQQWVHPGGFSRCSGELDSFAEPDGTMPTPPDPQREKLVALARRWQAENHRCNHAAMIAPSAATEDLYNERGRAVMDCARELLAELGIAEEVK